MPPDSVRALLESSRVIAVVGHSDQPDRDSYRIGHYLRQAGYRVYAVNPNLKSVDDEPAYPDLLSLPERVDIVNVFRQPQYVPEIVAAAVAIRARALWTQLGVSHPGAEAVAHLAGLVVVSNRCIMVDHMDLSSFPR